MLTILVILFITNGITLKMLFRKPDSQVIEKLEDARIRMDSVSMHLEHAQSSLDTVIESLGKTGEKAVQLDKQVMMISAEFDKRKSMSRQKIDEIHGKIVADQQKLKALQQELKEW